jgi:uncharacterized protein YndB with AHSA1/START domain
MSIHAEAEIQVERPRAEVFDYIAHAERLPEYVGDFEHVEQESEGEPRQGTTYRYKMKRGGVEGTFDWTEFRPPDRLAWAGPRVSQGPGSMAPSGWWELSDAGEGATRVKLVMTPEPGGLFKVIAPVIGLGMRRSNAKALQKLKSNVESGEGS